MIHRKKIPVILGIFAMGIGLVLSGCTAGVNPGQENEIAEKGDGGDYIPISVPGQIWILRGKRQWKSICL